MSGAASNASYGTADPLRGLRVGLIERRHPPGYRGAVVETLIPLLKKRGARVDLVHAEENPYRLDAAPPWDLAVLKSGSAAALHLATAAESWGIPCVNGSEATRLAQDRLASAAVLRSAGLPVPWSRLAWLGKEHLAGDDSLRKSLETLAGRAWIVKAARGSRGAGLWTAETGKLPELAVNLPEGPYLIMEKVPRRGDDLKVYGAGGWIAAIERPFPAISLREKLGRPVRIPYEAEETAREAGRLLGLSCFGCDFVRGPEGWMLVDVNAFPGYKGAEGAPQALAAEISRVASVLMAEARA